MNNLRMQKLAQLRGIVKTAAPTADPPELALQRKTVKMFRDAAKYLNQWMPKMDYDSAVRYLNRTFDFDYVTSSLTPADKTYLETNRAGNWDNYVSALTKIINDYYKKGRTTSGGGGGGSSAPTVTLKAPVNTILREVGTDEKDYLYTIISPTSFSYQMKGMATPKVVTTSYSKWNEAATNLNNLYTKQTPAATPAATPADPAATAAPVTPAAAGLDQAIVSKIAKVLTVGMTKPLAIATAGDEITQITQMSTFLEPKGGIMALASIIASKVGRTLGALNEADIATVSKAGQKELAINRGGQFAADTAVIMRQVNLLYKAFLDSKESLNAYWGKKASTSLDKKFVKAATLRRMRIRSQMEAAVDSSAQMGRSRVF